MIRFIRYFLFLVGAIQLLMAVAYLLQWPFMLELWPFEGTTPLTFTFVSPILTAAAASTLWVAASGNYGALAGIALDYVSILTPVAIFQFRLGAAGSDSRLTIYGILLTLTALLGLGLFLWRARIPVDRIIPLPRPVRWSFAIFIIVLVIVATRLIIKVPNVIPWKITPDLSVLIGWMFLGAAFYFAYSVARRSWYNAAGQLAGFLAYDLVLIVPFLERLPTIAPEFRIGLIIYIVVVVYSGLLAVYYLFIHKPTWLWNRTPVRAYGSQG